MAKAPKNTDPDPTERDPKELDYEQAVEHLEAIVEQIESGRIGLEDSIKAYERGVALVARCRQILDRAEQKIIELDGSALSSDASAPEQVEPSDDPADDQ